VQDEKTLQQVFKDIDQLEKTEIATKDKIHYTEEFVPYAYAALFFFILERMLALFLWRQWA
jgi:Ca-activated chloride channel family protein